MITRCPECVTAFRVTPEQIDARQGRVRCGHCGEIFDAVAALESAEEEEVRSDQAEPDEANAVAGERSVPRSSPDPEWFDAESQSEANAPEQPAQLGEEPRAEAESAQPDQTVASETAPDPAMPFALPIDPEPVPPLEHSSPEISFGRKKKSSPWWTAAAALLLVALSAQALFYFRGAIALVSPGAKPYIQQFCARLGCEVPLPRRAELMSIETSDLQADAANPGVVVLSATMRNRAAFPQAYPALELTLTNERDEPLARRVLQPADYLERGSQAHSAQEGLASCAGGQPSCEFQVKILFEAASLKASGYRLYLFYP